MAMIVGFEAIVIKLFSANLMNFLLFSSSTYFEFSILNKATTQLITDR